MSRVMDTEAYLGTLQELVRAGETVNVPLSGHSMLPFLAGGRDTVIFKAPDRPYKVGDVAFYVRPSGSYIVHRIRRIHRDGSMDFLGDYHTEIERGIPADSVFALVVGAVRKGKTIGPDNFVWQFYRLFWPLTRPIRPLLFRFALFLKRHHLMK